MGVNYFKPKLINSLLIFESRHFIKKYMTAASKWVDRSTFHPRYTTNKIYDFNFSFLKKKKYGLFRTKVMGYSISSFKKAKQYMNT